MGVNLELDAGEQIPPMLPTLESVLCTEELNRRPSRPPDYEKESRALISLALALADSPSTILKTLADKILEVFQADSSGISLLTEDKKRFYWPAIAGVWKPHIGGGTPRDFGPCGDVLDRNSPLLFRHFERRYTYLQPVMPPAEECLLVPFYIEGKAVGTIWVIAHDNRRKFDSEDLRMLVSLGTFASAIYKAVEQLHALRKRANESMESAQAIREMNEALVLSSIRQHELVETAESLNAQIREAHHQLERRVTERTAELAAANASLRAEIETRESSEESRRELLRRLATTQEDERRRIARDLHDQMGQHLTALGLGLKIVKDECSDLSTARDRLEKLQALTDLIGREIHQMALELRPTALDDLGLQTALAYYVERWSAQSGIAIDFQVVGPDKVRLPEAIETVLFRLIQEALTNVLRHSGARRVSLVLQQSPDQLVVVVEDDGVGFDAESLATPSWKEGRLGLLGMRERVALAGGTLMVESGPGRGTAVIVRVPLLTGGRKGGN